LNAHNIDDRDRSMYTAWNNKGTVAMNKRYMKSYDEGESVHGWQIWNEFTFVPDGHEPQSLVRPFPKSCRPQ